LILASCADDKEPAARPDSTADSAARPDSAPADSAPADSGETGPATPGATIIPAADASAVITGEEHADYAGVSIAAGDVNGDGQQDLLIGAFHGGEDVKPPPHEDDEPVGGPGAAYLLLGPIDGDAELAAADARLIGDRPQDITAMSVDIAGDLDADGYDDLVIGSQHAASTGTTFLVRGPVEGEVELRWEEGQIWGNDYGDHFGVTVAAAGDINGDGYDDVISSAKRITHPDYTGAAYVILGPVDPLFVEHERRVGLIASSYWHAEAFWDLFGMGVCSAGDVNGDGADDLLAGAPGDETAGPYAGAFYLVTAYTDGDHAIQDIAAAKLTSEAPGANLGVSCAPAGDTDGDGYGDFVVGAYKADGVAPDAGAAYLFRGPDIASGVAEAAAAASFAGEGDNHKLGYRVETAGDLNADGLDDVVIGAPFSDAAGEVSGAAYVFLGPIEGAAIAAARIEGGGERHYMGVSVAGVGDIDGDGAAELAAGAFGIDYNRGEVFLFGGWEGM